MFASAAAIILWASQLTLGAQCACPTEGITETYRDGSRWIGAIAETTEASVGVYVAPDGSMVVELNR